MMMVRVPFSGKSEAGQPLLRCVRRAALETGLTDFQVAMVVSFFFEELANEVGAGRVVRVPGIGAFGALLWRPRHGPDAPAYAYPAFSGSDAFRQQVKWECPADGAADRTLRRHRQSRHPSGADGRQSRRTRSAMRAFRERVRAQARRLGYDLP